MLRMAGHPHDSAAASSSPVIKILRSLDTTKAEHNKVNQYSKLRHDSRMVRRVGPPAHSFRDLSLMREPHLRRSRYQHSISATMRVMDPNSKEL